jgi:hypothetical protein
MGTPKTAKPNRRKDNKANVESISVQIKNGEGFDETRRIDALRSSMNPEPARGAMVRSLYLAGLEARERAASKRKTKVSP